MNAANEASAAVLRWLDAMPLPDNPGWRATPSERAPVWAQWLAEARAIADLENGLVALLRSGADPLRRSVAALALGLVGNHETGNEAAHAALLAALANDVALVAMEAAGALGRWGRPADAAALCGALSGPDANVRASACTALARLGGAAALAGLRAAAGDADPFVRAAATEALQHMAATAANRDAG